MKNENTRSFPNNARPTVAKQLFQNQTTPFNSKGDQRVQKEIIRERNLRSVK